MTLRTKTFQVRPAQVARVAAIVYVRQLWFAIIGFPLFGIYLISVAKDPLLQYVALVSILWPLTIPGRSYLVTRRSAATLLRPTFVTVEDGFLLFHAVEGKGLKIGLDRILGTFVSGDVLVLNVRYLRFALIPLDAFESEADRTVLLEAIHDAGAASPRPAGP